MSFVKRNKSRKAAAKLKDLLHEIALRAAEEKDKRTHRDASDAIALLEELSNHIEMEDRAADPSIIRVVS